MILESSMVKHLRRKGRKRESENINLKHSFSCVLSSYENSLSLACKKKLRKTRIALGLLLFHSDARTFDLNSYPFPSGKLRTIM